MKPTKITLTGNGSGTTNTDPVPLNYRAEVTALSFKTSGSTTGFTVQFTLEPVEGYATAAAWASAATWHNSSIAAATANAAGSISHPVTGVRLQANGSGTDTGTLVILQSLT